MTFRVVTLNLEQDHKRWPARRPLIEAELARLKPDIVGLNEVSVPLRSAQLLRTTLSTAAGTGYGLVQQTKVNGLSKVEAEAMLSRFPVIESGNLDYRAGDMVALVARVLVDGSPLDVFVTHLYRSRGEESLRLFQVQQLLEWIDTRDPAVPRIVCGDFNASLDKPSAALMATRFRPTQTAPTAFTALADRDGSVSHPYWPRLDRCIDYIWVSPDIEVVGSGVCFDTPSPTDAALWPSDHAGVWADLSLSPAARHS